MGTKQNFIEINGKRYDAVTGKIMGSSSESAYQPVLDGFVKRPKHHSTAPSSRNVNALTPTNIQHSKTLMRAAVKKPGVQTPKKALAVLASPTPRPAPKQVLPKATITPRVAVAPQSRQQHAAEVQKSTLVNRFGTPQHMAAPTIVKKIAPMQVEPMPAHMTAPAHPPAAAVPKSKTADLLDRALEAAQGHNEPFYEHKKPLHRRIAKRVGLSGKAMAISTTVFAGLLLGGFYAYQNVPNLAMRVAATRAGFSAAMPGYAPSGFAFKGPVQYGAGQVVVSFKSNTDDRSYKLTQQTSSWSSDSLLNNFVAVSGKEYQTYQDRGRTIYIYDGSNATWVNGGIWYQVDGKSALSSDQLVRIAASL